MIAARAYRREIKRLKEEAEHKEKEAQAARERREARFAPRGVEASPLEYLYNQKHLANVDVEGEDEQSRANNAMRRYEAGVSMRSMLESIYGSGIKSQDFESAGGGGGGAGVVIHAVVAENINSIKSMMRTESFFMLEQMLLQGLFVWQIPSDKGKEILIEEVRDALDRVSVFLGMMPGTDDDDIPKRGNRRRVRERNLFARDALAKAQRSTK